MERGTPSFGSALRIERPRRVECFGIHRDHGAKTRALPVVGLDARQTDLRQLLGGQRAGVERGVEVRDGRRLQIDDFSRRHRRERSHEQRGQ